MIVTQLVAALGASLGFAGFINAERTNGAGNVVDDLKSLLSKGASVSTNISDAHRWSEYNSPSPGYIVNVAEELDVAKTVRSFLKERAFQTG